MKVLILLALVAVAAARPDVSHLLASQGPQASVQRAYVKPPAILRQVQETSERGDYKYNFETENGIQAVAQAQLEGEGTPEEALVSQGSYSYIGEDGKPVSVNWIADQYGFRASGTHIHDIPEEIKKGLEQAANEPEDDGQYREDPSVYDRPQFQQQQQQQRLINVRRF